MRKPWKYGMLGALIVIAVLYGIELTSQGLADVYGPLDQGTIASAPEVTGALGAPTDGESTGTAAGQPSGIAELGGGKDQATVESSPSIAGDDAASPTLPSTSGEPSVNRLADGTAGLLQSVSSGGIRFVVSMFEAITD